MTDLINQTQQVDEMPAIPEKFKDHETGAVRVNDLVSSYLELEKKLSTMMPSPDTEEGQVRLRKMMGVPEEAGSYDIKCDHGLFCVDEEINEKLLEKGFTNEQAQTLYDLAAQKFVPLVLEIAEEFKADREIDRLVAAFGGTDKWKEVSRQLLSFGKKNLPDEVLQSLSGSFEGVMMLYRMMKGQETEFGRVPGDDTAEGGGNKEELSVMMRDPRYWRDKDPSFVAKVTEGFQRAYGE